MTPTDPMVAPPWCSTIYWKVGVNTVKTLKLKKNRWGVHAPYVGAALCWCRPMTPMLVPPLRRRVCAAQSMLNETKT